MPNQVTFTQQLKRNNYSSLLFAYLFVDRNGYQNQMGGSMSTKGIKLMIVALFGTLTVYLIATAQTQEKSPTGKQAQMVERGRYLVNLGGCNDCHSPKVFTAKGPEPDPKRLLSGHPADEKLPAVPDGLFGPTAWGGLCNNGMTAWVGPWGISFASNLTPDNVTGSGAWTEAAFIKAMRTGKHLGAGRDILPPMPWPFIGQLTDEDLGAIFAYIESLPPIDNMVPQPVPPSGK
jgi:mono/diheme cytochrome c family protein